MEGDISKVVFERGKGNRRQAFGLSDCVAE